MKVFRIFFLVLVIVTFSPLVIPENVDTPWLFGMPRTLWTGILMSIVMAVFTLWAALTIKDDD